MPHKQITTVKKRLCKICDKLMAVFLSKDIPEKERRAVLNAQIEIDDCVEMLEKIISKLKK